MHSCVIHNNKGLDAKSSFKSQGTLHWDVMKYTQLHDVVFGKFHVLFKS